MAHRCHCFPRGGFVERTTDDSPPLPPPPVVQIARNDDEVDVLLSGLPDQSVEHLSRRSPDSLGEAAFLSREAEERTLQMNVRRVEKAK